MRQTVPEDTRAPSLPLPKTNKACRHSTAVTAARNGGKQVIEQQAEKKTRKRRSLRLRPTVGSVREKNSAWYWDVYENKKHRMIRLGSAREGEREYLPSKQDAINKANELNSERERLSHQQ